MSWLFQRRFFALALLLLACTPLLAGGTRSAFPSPPAAARVYLNPNTGRFWTMDSYEGSNQDPQTLHKYLYAHANPVNGVDPSGHEFSMIGVLTTTFTIATVASKVYVSYKVGHLIGSGIRFTYDEEMTFDELLDESLKTGVDIAGGWAVGRGVGFAFNRWIGPVARKLTPLIWQRAHQLGRAAEASIFARHNMFKNSKSLTELGGRGDFVPDGITTEVLREVKNVARLQLDDQIRAFAAFCQQTGRKFVIHVRPGSRVDGTVVNEMQRVFGSGSRGSAWDIVSDIPDEMRIATQLVLTCIDMRYNITSAACPELRRKLTVVRRTGKPCNDWRRAGPKPNKPWSEPA